MNDRPSDHEMREFNKRLDRHYATMQSVLARLTTLEQAPCSPASPAPAGCTTSGSGATTPPDARNSGPLDTSAAESAGKRSSSDPSAAIRADPNRPAWLTEAMLPLPVGTERVYGESDTRVRIAMPSGHLWADYDPHWDCARANREIDADHWEVYHVPPPQPEKAKPAAASAWEEFCAMCGYDPMEWRPLAFDVFNRWVSAREKAAVEAWNRTIFPITATHPSGALSVKVHIEDGNCVVATTDAKPLPKPDAGRAEGVKDSPRSVAAMCRAAASLEYAEAIVKEALAPRPRRAPEVVAREVARQWYEDDAPGETSAMREGRLAEIIAAAVRADRGEG